MSGTFVTVTPLTSVTNGDPIILNADGANPLAGLQVVISGTGTYKVQCTMYDPTWADVYSYPGAPYTTLMPTRNFAADATWFDHDTLVNLTASDAGNLVVPVSAARLVCTAFTSGYGYLIVKQPTR